MRKKMCIRDRVNGNIHHTPPSAAHQLGLGIGRVLKVQSADDALFGGKRLVVLDKGAADAGCLIFFKGIGFKEITPVVAEHIRLHENKPLDGESGSFHSNLL